MATFIRRSLCSAAFLLVLMGCGTKTYPVRGQVQFDDGTPATELAGHLINFQSLDHKTSASGIIQADGTFSVGTLSDTDGAMPGKHRVAISAPAWELGQKKYPVVIAPRYGQFDTSGLDVEVKLESNDLTIKVERLKK